MKNLPYLPIVFVLFFFSQSVSAWGSLGGQSLRFVAPAARLGAPAAVGALTPGANAAETSVTPTNPFQSYGNLPQYSYPGYTGSTGYFDPGISTYNPYIYNPCAFVDVTNPYMLYACGW